METFFDLFCESHPLHLWAEQPQSRKDYRLVNFVEKQLDNNFIIDAIFSLVPMRLEKHDNKSYKYGKKGNTLYFRKSSNYWLEGLKWYNQSICYAEPNSYNVGVGYANRSSLLYQMKLYRESLMNIEMARNSNYPRCWYPKLDRREERCRRKLNQQYTNEIRNDYQLVGGPHKVVPFVSECLQFEPEKKSVVSKRNLSVGDLVAMEQPFCSVVHPNNRYTHCAVCQQECFMMVLPCDRCCAAVFCSEECKQMADKGFHRYECPIIDFLIALFRQDSQLAGLRMTLTLLDQLTNIQELKQFCDHPDNQGKNVFDLHVSAGGNLTPLEHYRALHGLHSFEENRPAKSFGFIVFGTAILKYLIMNFSPLKNRPLDEKSVNFITELLLHHQLCAASPRLQSITNGRMPYMNSMGIYPLMSLFFHSCAPNAVRVFKDTKAYVFALRPIKSGEVLRCSFGSTYATASQEDRLYDIERRYFIKCSCVACEWIYPMQDKLQENPNVPPMQGFQKFSDFCEFVNKHDVIYPCSQVYRAQDAVIAELYFQLTHKDGYF